MNIAIVGSSRLSENEERDARQMISFILKNHGNDIVLVSGGANGIDSIAEEIVDGLGIKKIIFKPKINQWEGDGGFKERNIKIAEKCDILYCLASQLKNENDISCYHCNLNHRVTGGCFTMKYAEGLKKEIYLIEPIKRSA